MAGEGKLAVTTYAYNNEGLRAANAPVDWVAEDLIPALIYPLTLARNAPHPYAAALFYDYLISEEGQRLIAREGRVVAHPKVEPIYPRMKEAAKSARHIAHPAQHTGAKCQAVEGRRADPRRSGFEAKVCRALNGVPMFRAETLDHVAFPVRDLPRSEKFYLETVGLTFLTQRKNATARRATLT